MGLNCGSCVAHGPKVVLGRSGIQEARQAAGPMAQRLEAPRQKSEHRRPRKADGRLITRETEVDDRSGNMPVAANPNRANRALIILDVVGVFMFYKRF
jgi:hypothetical protein